jgi:hypothetical protein
MPLSDWVHCSFVLHVRTPTRLPVILMLLQIFSVLAGFASSEAAAVAADVSPAAEAASAMDKNADKNIQENPSL